MTTAQLLGALLALWGATGMYVAGRKSWVGWAMGLAIQPVWVVFAVVVDSWPLILSPLLYGTVYLRNLVRWKTGGVPEPAKTRVLFAARVVDGHKLQPDLPRRQRREMARRSRS